MTSSVKTLNENLSEGLTGIEYIQMAVNQLEPQLKAYPFLSDVARFKVVSYKTAENIYYFIKVNVGDDKFVHLRVFQSPTLLRGAPDQTFILENVKANCRLEDPIEAF